jgi:hypothetical protein
MNIFWSNVAHVCGGTWASDIERIQIACFGNFLGTLKVTVIVLAALGCDGLTVNRGAASATAGATATAAIVRPPHISVRTIVR